MNKQILEVTNELMAIDRQLGRLWDQPALQKAPQYTRAHLTELRDRLVKAANVLHKLNH